MLTLTQARTLSLSGAALPTYSADGLPVFVPVRLQGTETIGRLDACRYLVTLRTDDAYAFSPSITANLDLDKVVGTEVTVSVELEGKGQFVPGMAGDTGQGNIGAGVREITGLVEAARIAGEDRHSILYELELRPWLYRTTLTQDCRIFQDMSVVEITDAVLAKYPYAVDKRLAGAIGGVYPKRDIQRQAFETDWAFLQRLWEEWGIWWWFEHDDGHHRLVLCDALGGHHPHGPAYATLRYLPPDSKRVDEEHIHTLSVTSRLTSGRVSVTDYDYTRPRADLGVTEDDPRKTASADGEIYDWGDHSQPLAGAQGLTGEPNDAEREARHLARVRLDAKRCAGWRAHGRGNLRGLTVGRTFTLTGYAQEAANREYLVVSCTLDIEEVADRAGGAGTYRCEAQFELQPANAPFRLERSVEKPRLSGPEKAIVVGPVEQEIWTDRLGRVKAQFAWDRHGKLDEQAGIWLRVLSPWQGADMGASFIPRVGHEVAVMHYYGDPDLPVIAGSLANAFREPALDLPANQAVSVVRGREFRGTASGQVMIDDTQGQIQTQIGSDAGASHLSLGHIRRIVRKKGRADARGKGFDLRTDYWGVVRALLGLFLSTDGQPGGPGHAKDAREAVARLTRARELQESLAGLAQQHEAQTRNADQSEVAQAIQARNDAIRGDAPAGENDFPEFKERDIVLAGPAGISLGAQHCVHVASNEDVALTAGRHVGLAVGHSLFASVSNALSVFVHKAGMALVAAAGKVRIEAQSDGIDVRAKQAVNVASTADSIHLHAAKEIVLHAGSTKVCISDQGYTVHTGGEHTVRAGSHQTDGPQGQGGGFPPFPKSGPGQLEVLRRYVTDSPVGKSAFTVTDSAGAAHKGTLDGAGRAVVSGLAAGAVNVGYARDPHDPWVSSSRLEQPRWQPEGAV